MNHLHIHETADRQVVVCTCMAHLQGFQCAPHCRLRHFQRCTCLRPGSMALFPTTKQEKREELDADRRASLTEKYDTVSKSISGV